MSNEQQPTEETPLMEPLFIHLLDFTAREIVEIVCTKNPEVIHVDDSAKMAEVACGLIDKHDVALILKSRIKEYLNVS